MNIEKFWLHLHMVHVGISVAALASNSIAKTVMGLCTENTRPCRTLDISRHIVGHQTFDYEK